MSTWWQCWRSGLFRKKESNGDIRMHLSGRVMQHGKKKVLQKPFPNPSEEHFEFVFIIPSLKLALHRMEMKLLGLHNPLAEKRRVGVQQCSLHFRTLPKHPAPTPTSVWVDRREGGIWSQLGNKKGGWDFSVSPMWLESPHAPSPLLGTGLRSLHHFCPLGC